MNEKIATITVENGGKIILPQKALLRLGTSDGGKIILQKFGNYELLLSPDNSNTPL
ncbi:MAG: hypothetical protein LBN97_05880 [Oscillospiraceae bacterium]|jgi:hypothetical protein|nr:hypothetical protein [Oscillospiraceae bacterium]